MISCISKSNTPSAYILNTAVLNKYIVILCDSCFSFICRLENCKVDTAVVHVLIINISFYIMDVKVTENDVIYCSCVLSHNSNTCSVHLVSKAVILILEAYIVYNLKTANLDVLYIVEQDC